MIGTDAERAVRSLPMGLCRVRACLASGIEEETQSMTG